MKNIWRKIAVITAAAVLLTALCGCGRKSVNDTMSAKNMQTLVIGSDIYEPYNYIDTDGNRTGIDVEFAEAVCKKMGLRPVFVQINWDDKDEMLKSGKIDCLWGSFSMNGREKLYRWAGPYMHSYQVVAVRDGANIRYISDLDGKRVSVQNGSKPEEYFLNDSSAPNVKNVYCFSKSDEAFAALKKGYVDACALHELPMRQMIERSDGEYRILKNPLMRSNLGVAFSENSDSEIVEKMNKAMSEVIGNGTLEKILKKYDVDTSYIIKR